MLEENLEENFNVSLQPIEEIASEAASLISQRLSKSDLIKLLQIAFLTVEEAAQLLRVKSKTISTWISQGRIPVRYANGRPLFLLPELLAWTVPENDSHKIHRLTTTASSKIAANRLAVVYRKEPQ